MMKFDVLLVGEDFKAHISLLERITEVRYTVASTAEEAVEKMQGILFDIVVIDPDINNSDRALIRKMLEIQQPEALLLDVDTIEPDALGSLLSNHIKSLKSQLKATYVVKDDVFSF
ncbi:hypothetical protein HQ29_09080 [Porphyromonas canoris]|uniref:hypothetical protein n=1 Tax=Porphyromonas TaxID=836 RepID=UPI00051D8B0D|nr:MULTISPECIES: hypothetical protein [Porphyromonas]KGL51134.1 hypothetical protein HQ29_09080 [Porphyromonas canoris]KGN94469.1 hypothetical protein HQ39_09100 [Porphyromonas sp. COT-108 OH2963]